MRSGFGRHVETLGNADLYEDNKYGEHIGYIITCGRHLDAGDDGAKIECKNFCSFGRRDRISHEECIRRLKRWYVMGYFGAKSWPDTELRTKHIGCAGPRCQNFASEIVEWNDVSDADLDEMVRRVPAVSCTLRMSPGFAEGDSRLCRW